MSRPTGSYLQTYGEVHKCTGCERYYRAGRASCPWCSAANAEAPERPSSPVPNGSNRDGPASVALDVSPGGWAAAYYPENPRKCVAKGHIYAGVHGDQCPQCRGGGGRGTAGRGMFAGLR